MQRQRHSFPIKLADVNGQNDIVIATDRGVHILYTHRPDV